MVTQVAVLLQGLIDNLFELRREIRVQPYRRRRHTIQNRVGNHAGSFTAKWQSSGSHLIKHHAKRKQVRARVQFLAAHLLGRHIRDRTHRNTGAGEIFRSHSRRHLPRKHSVLRNGMRHRAAQLLGQPKVQNLGVAALGDKYVCGLDVAVNDSLAVRGVQSIGNPNRQAQQHIGVHRLSGDAMLQRGAVQIFHGDERFAAVIVNFVDGANVRMIQRGCRLRFALKAAEYLRIFGDIVRQKLQRHKAAELQILSLVNHTHAAATEFFDDPVVRNSLADER